MRIEGLNLLKELGRDRLIVSSVVFKREQSTPSTVGKLTFQYGRFAGVARLIELEPALGWFYLTFEEQFLVHSPVANIIKHLWAIHGLRALKKTRLTERPHESNYYSFSLSELSFESNQRGGKDEREDSP